VRESEGGRTQEAKTQLPPRTRQQPARPSVGRILKPETRKHARRRHHMATGFAKGGFEQRGRHYARCWVVWVEVWCGFCEVMASAPRQRTPVGHSQLASIPHRNWTCVREREGGGGGRGDRERVDLVVEQTGDSRNEAAAVHGRAAVERERKKDRDREREREREREWACECVRVCVCVCVSERERERERGPCG